MRNILFQKFLLVVIFSVSLLYCSGQRKLPVASLLEDAEFINQHYLSMHVNPYGPCDSVTFHKAYHNFVRKLNRPMHEQEFYYLSSQFLSVIADDHTRIDINPESIGLGDALFRKLIYYDVEVRDNKLFVASNYKKRSKIPEGAEIISINGVSTDELLSNVRGCFGAHSTTLKYKQFASRFWFHTWKLLGMKGRFRTAYLDSEEKLQVEKKRGVGLIPLIYRRGHNSTPEQSEPGNLLYDSLSTPVVWLTDTLLNQGSAKRSDYAYWQVKHSNTAIITFDHFDVPARNAIIEQFFDTTFSLIQKAQPENLIIDLRNNSGGYVGLMPVLLKHFYQGPFRIADSSNKVKITSEHVKWFNKYNDTIWAECAKAYQGMLIAPDTTCLKSAFSCMDITPDSIFYNDFESIYVLTGPDTYSNALVFSDALRYNIPGAKVVGLPTLAMRCFYGSKMMMQIPHSGLYLSVSASHHISPYGKCDPNEVLEPDIRVSDKMLVRRLLELTTGKP